MSKFNTKGKEVKEEVKVSKWLEPLKAHVAMIDEVEYFESSQKSTPGMKIIFRGKPMAELEGVGQKAEETLWLSDAAYEYTERTLLLIVDKMGVRAEFDNLTSQINANMSPAEQAQAYVNAFATVTRNKPMTFIFGGEEIMLTNDEGERNIWVKPALARYGFVGQTNELEDYQGRVEKLGDKLLRKLEVEATTTTASDITSTTTADEIEW